MTNLVVIILTNVAAGSTVDWSNDLSNWHAYSCHYYNVPEIRLRVNPQREPMRFFRYTQAK